MENRHYEPDLLSRMVWFEASFLASIRNVVTVLSGECSACLSGVFAAFVNAPDCRAPGSCEQKERGRKPKGWRRDWSLVTLPHLLLPQLPDKFIGRTRRKLLNDSLQSINVK